MGEYTVALTSIEAKLLASIGEAAPNIQEDKVIEILETLIEKLKRGQNGD